jgi:hypothetical protein
MLFFQIPVENVQGRGGRERRVMGKGQEGCNEKSGRYMIRKRK